MGQSREERRLRVFENRLLRRIFGPKREEVRGEWRKLHNEELNDLYSLPNIIRVIISRERDHLEDLGVEGRIIIWILRKWNVGAWTGSIWFRIGTGGGHL